MPNNAMITSPLVTAGLSSASAAFCTRRIMTMLANIVTTPIVGMRRLGKGVGGGGQAWKFFRTYKYEAAQTAMVIPSMNMNIKVPHHVIARLPKTTLGSSLTSPAIL
jgi:hypothetical protein